MTLTTACIESWPVTVFWTWLSMAAGIALYLIVGGYTRPYFEKRRARQRGEGAK